MQRTRLRTRLNGRKRTPDWVTEKADRAEERLAQGPVDSLLTGNPHIDGMIREDRRRSRKDRRGRRSRTEDYKKYREPPDDSDPMDVMEGVMRTGRPPLLTNDEPTRRLVYGLAAIQCTKIEAAAVFGVTWQTFHNFLNRHDEVKRIWDDGRPVGKASLRRKQFAMAEKSAPMAIWLGKQYLEQRDKVDVAGPNGGPLQSVSVDAAQLAKLSPKQRIALQQALQIIRPEMFEGITPETDPKLIEYDPDS